MADTELPKKKHAAPLHGMLGSAGRMVLGIAFMSMNLGMLRNLALTVGMALPSPLLKAHLANATFGNKLTNNPAAPAISPMQIKPPTPRA